MYSTQRYQSTDILVCYTKISVDIPYVLYKDLKQIQGVIEQLTYGQKNMGAIIDRDIKANMIVQCRQQKEFFL